MKTSEEILRAENELRSSDGDLLDEQILPYPQNSSSRGNEHPSKESTSDTRNESFDYRYVPLRMGGNGGTHVPSEGSRALIEKEISLHDLLTMTNKFYEMAFQDYTLDKLIRSHHDPHGSRFAKWIHQKLTGSDLWDQDRRTRDLTPVEVAGGRTAVVHDRTSAHAAAWYSPKRPQREVGRRFNLEECRVWMRLHFWAMRESGVVDKSPTFADYYVRFIGHFVAVYERSATRFARESFRWSADPANTDKYIQDGRKMKDVLGVPPSTAARDLPEEERNDNEWPYFVNQ